MSLLVTVTSHLELSLISRTLYANAHVHAKNTQIHTRTYTHTHNHTHTYAYTYTYTRTDAQSARRVRIGASETGFDTIGTVFVLALTYSYTHVDAHAHLRTCSTDYLGKFFDVMDTILVIYFTVEVLVNLFANSDNCFKVCLVSVCVSECVNVSVSCVCL